LFIAGSKARNVVVTGGEEGVEHRGAEGGRGALRVGTIGPLGGKGAFRVGTIGTRGGKGALFLMGLANLFLLRREIVQGIGGGFRVGKSERRLTNFGGPNVCISMGSTYNVSGKFAGSEYSDLNFSTKSSKVQFFAFIVSSPSS